MAQRPPLSPVHQERLQRVIQDLINKVLGEARKEIHAATTTIIGGNGGGGGGGTGDDVTLAGDVVGEALSNLLMKIRGVPVSGIAPSEGQALVFNGTEWVPGAPGDTSGVIIDYSTLVNEATTPQGATFSASSTSGIATETADYAADGDDSTYWLSESVTYPGQPALDAWWKADLGSAKEITWYRVVQGATPFRASSSKLQSSTDNSTWTDQVTFGVFGDSGLLELPSPVTARYWRVLGIAQVPLVSLAANNWGLATVALYSGQPTEQSPGHAIQDEGIQLTSRPALDFVGPGVTATDDPTNDKTIVTIPGVTATTRWEPLTNGDVDFPELVFAGGEVIMVEVPL